MPAKFALSTTKAILVRSARFVKAQPQPMLKRCQHNRRKRTQSPPSDSTRIKWRAWLCSRRARKTLRNRPTQLRLRILLVEKNQSKLRKKRLGWPKLLNRRRASSPTTQTPTLSSISSPRTTRARVCALLSQELPCLTRKSKCSTSTLSTLSTAKATFSAC